MHCRFALSTLPCVWFCCLRRCILDAAVGCRLNCWSFHSPYRFVALFVFAAGLCLAMRYHLCCCWRFSSRMDDTFSRKILAVIFDKQDKLHSAAAINLCRPLYRDALNRCGLFTFRLRHAGYSCLVIGSAEVVFGCKFSFKSYRFSGFDGKGAPQERLVIPRDNDGCSFNFLSMILCGNPGTWLVKYAIGTTTIISLWKWEDSLDLSPMRERITGNHQVYSHKENANSTSSEPSITEWVEHFVYMHSIYIQDKTKNYKKRGWNHPVWF